MYQYSLDFEGIIYSGGLIHICFLVYQQVDVGGTESK